MPLDNARTAGDPCCCNDIDLLPQAIATSNMVKDRSRVVLLRRRKDMLTMLSRDGAYVNGQGAWDLINCHVYRTTSSPNAKDLAKMPDTSQTKRLAQPTQQVITRFSSIKPLVVLLQCMLKPPQTCSSTKATAPPCKHPHESPNS
jgi:hypothetical protein